MKLILAAILLGFATMTSCMTSPGTYTEFSRTYSPDSSKYLLKYDYMQGAWDGGRTWFMAIVRAKDSVKEYDISNLDFDKIYWKGSDTVIIEEKYTEFKSQGKSPNLSDTVLNDVTIKVIQKDPIDTSYTRKIYYRQASPDNKYELVVYRYIKPVNGNYFLNISIINKGDSIPKYGNFYISRYDFDCFNNIKWGSSDTLDIGVSKSCYYAFKDYLVKNRPEINYNVQIDDTSKGNVQMY